MKAENGNYCPTNPNHLNPLYRSILIALYVIAIGSVFLGLIALKPEWKVLFFPEEPKSEQSPHTQQSLAKIQERFGKNPTLIPQKHPKKDNSNTLKQKDSTHSQEVVPISKDSLQSAIEIQYPDGNRQALYQFFRSLESLDNNENQLYRVLHYGDSQLEGDRISSSLRKNLQEHFGGCGAGLQGATNYTNVKFSVLQENDSRWKNYFILGQKKANFGLLAYSFQFDSLAQITFSKSAQTYPLHQKVENVKILYQNALLLQWEENNLTPQEKYLENIGAAIEEIPLTQDFEELKIRFRGTKNTEIYGISLDCRRGIAVDNIPIRGSAGLEFRRMNAANLQKQTKDLQVRLVILQFGVNVTMSAKDYSFYENKFVEEILFLKKCIPNASFLLIGISDRSYKTPSGYASYPAVELLRNTQKRIAARTGCAFWDLYEAMGGKNSMPLWVAEDLASKDFIHFKPKGAELIGNMLAEALLQEYKKFRGFSP